MICPVFSFYPEKKCRNVPAVSPAIKLNQLLIPAVLTFTDRVLADFIVGLSEVVDTLAD